MTQTFDPAPPVDVSMTTHEGHVVLKFSRPIDQLVLSPNFAAQLSRNLSVALIDIGREAKKGAMNGTSASAIAKRDV